MAKKTVILDENDFNIEESNIEVINTNDHMQEQEKKEVAKEIKKTKTEDKKKPIFFRLALSEENHKYITLMSELMEGKDKSMTKYINMLIEKDKKKNKVLYEKLIEIENNKLEALNNI
jgi:hypothetical protein